MVYRCIVMPMTDKVTYVDSAIHVGLLMHQIPVCCQQFYGTIASDRVFKFGYLISEREVMKNIKILSI